MINFVKIFIAWVITLLVLILGVFILNRCTLFSTTLYSFQEYEEIHTSLLHGGKLSISLSPDTEEKSFRDGKPLRIYKSPYWVGIYFEYPKEIEGTIELLSITIEQSSSGYNKSFKNMGKENLSYSISFKDNFAGFAPEKLELPYKPLTFTCRAKISIKGEKAEEFYFTTTINPKLRETEENDFINRIKSV